MNKAMPLTEQTANQALQDLSQLMGVHCPQEHIDIRAVGGYAMVARGLRGDSGMTLDIDTATPTYPQSIRNLIHVVADDMGLECDWLNNDCVFTMNNETTEDDVYYFDDLLCAQYDQYADYGNITVYVATTETLMRAKAFAVSDEATGVGYGRDIHKDLNDLVMLLKSADVTSYNQAISAYPWLTDPDISGCLTPIETAFENMKKPAPVMTGGLK